MQGFPRRALALAFAGAVVLQAPHAGAQTITSPKQQFGFNIGDDYKLANYTQFEAYFHKLAKESNRMRLVEIGKTAEGRPQLMAIISTPANLAKLDHYKDISSKLAHGKISEEEARTLSREGKSIVWIDGGLHATEVLGAAQLIETVYQLVSKSDPETMRFLNDCIILATHANPDGMELVSNWYMKDADTLKRNLNIPRLYQKYIGHDDNRDFYISNQPETQNVNHVLYWEWYPQIVYNHHQTGPAGTVMFAPPFRDPFNFNFDPLIPVELDLVAASMHSRFEAEGKPGVTMRSGSTYSTWWNGGLRTTVYFHNQIGLLTEAIGNPTPMNIPFVPEQQLPRADLPYPIAPQRWHFRQSIEYSLTANRAVLDIASRERENLLFNFWKMGHNSIERGNRDTWTASPKRIEEVKAVIAQAEGGAVAGGGGRGGRGGRGAGAAAAAPAEAPTGPVGDPIAQFGRGADAKYFTEVLHAPDKRDPRGYILPSNQPDFPTATKFINALLHVGVDVHRATSAFTVAGKQYPAGSYVVKSAQAFRPHVLDMFEPQDHPNDFAYPGGPPKRPYDNAGYTLAFQMGVQFDRILDGFDGPFQLIPHGELAKPMAGGVATSNATKGYMISHSINDAFILVNRALKANADVYELRSSMNGFFPAGTFYVAATPATTALVNSIAKTNGVNIGVTTAAPPSDAKKLHQMRIALWDQYGGSMPSGHTRWLLEQFEFPFDVIYPPTLDGGNLASKYDVIILPSGAVPREGRGGGGGGGGGFGFAVDTNSIPAEFRGRMGRFTAARTIPALKQFIEAGGTVVAVGTSANLGMMMGLPITNALVEKNAAGVERDISADKYYVPGSILRAQVDTTALISAGLPRDLDVFFDNSPAYKLGPDASAKGLKVLATFPNGTPLRSGWAWGQGYLEGSVEAVEASIGKGKLYMFAPEVTFRGQPHGTFKWLFNGIYGGSDQLTP